jgi:hypothetical protein
MSTRQCDRCKKRASKTYGYHDKFEDWYYELCEECLGEKNPKAEALKRIIK